MDKAFIACVERMLALHAARHSPLPRAGLAKTRGQGCHVAGGVRIEFTPMAGRDELDLRLVWPPDAPKAGLANLHRYQPHGLVEVGFYLDARFLEDVERQFSSDLRQERHAFLPLAVDFQAMADVLSASKLSLEQIARRLDCTPAKAERLRFGYYRDKPSEITPALRRSLPDWSTLGKIAALPPAHVERACAGWAALLDCVLVDGVAEFTARLKALSVTVRPDAPLPSS